MIRLRPDIAAQVRRNTRPVLVDCRRGVRINADAITWELLKALDGALHLDAAQERFRKATGLVDVQRAELSEFLSGQGRELLDGVLDASRVKLERAALEREKLSRLDELVRYSRERVVAYERAFASFPKNYRVDDASKLSSLPALTKARIREEFPGGMLAKGIELGELLRNGKAEVLYSSGTTVHGERTPSIHLANEDRADQDAPFGLASSTSRQARFSTPRCTGRECHVEKQDRENRCFGTTLMLNSSADPMYMNKSAWSEVAAEIVDWSPEVLSGNPWYLATLLRALALLGLSLPDSIEVILLGTEFVSRPIARYVTERCGLLPFDNYSATEIGNIATNCPLGAYHVFDGVIVEIVRNNRPARVGEIGEVVVSHLGRRAMPLIRYRLGDLAMPLESCRCGLPQQPIAIMGRVSDCILPGDGRFITAFHLDDVIGDVPDLFFYRATQASDRGLTLEFSAIPGREGRTNEMALVLSDALREKLELPSCRMRAIERIHTRDSMKYSTIVSQVSGHGNEVSRLLGNEAIA